MSNWDNDSINEALLTIVSQTGLPLKKLANELKITPAQMMEQLSGKKSFVTKKHISGLERRWGIAFTDISKLDFSQDEIKERILGNNKLLPHRYSNHKKSRIRTTSNIIEYLEFIRGWKYAQGLLSKLNMHAGIFEHPEEKINFLFFQDLFQLLENEKVSDAQLRRMAYHSAIKNYHTPLGVKFRAARTHQELYTTLQVHIKQYDENFDYRISVEKERAVLFTKQNKEVAEGLQLNKMGSKRICIYKQHVFASLPVYKDWPTLTPIEKSCMYNGASQCEVHVEFKDHILRLL